MQQSSTEFVLEYARVSVGTQTGYPHNEKYIFIITVRDGHIRHYRNYWNLLVVLDSIGQPSSAGNIAT